MDNFLEPRLTDVQSGGNGMHDQGQGVGRGVGSVGGLGEAEGKFDNAAQIGAGGVVSGSY